MSLTHLQKAFGNVLLQPDGWQALTDEAGWDGYLKSSAYRDVLADYPRERVALYEELLFNTVEDTMKGFFPALHQLLGNQWVPVIEQYRRTCPSRSFHLYKIGEAFPVFLEQQPELLEAYPYLVDIAHYHWLEVGIYNAPNPDYPIGFEPELAWTPEFMEAYRPFWNPVSHLVRFEYPVPVILRQIQAWQDNDDPRPVLTVEPRPTTIMIYRDPQTLMARFFELPTLTAAVIQFSQTAASYAALFDMLQTQIPALQNIPLETVCAEGIKLLRQCHREGILVGAVPADPTLV